MVFNKEFPYLLYVEVLPLLRSLKRLYRASSGNSKS